jgi:D-sedoheptulose 7-phosphate isomerase
MKELIKSRIRESIDIKESILNNNLLIDQIQEIAEAVITAINNDKKVLFAGNGGSFSDSFHLAGEFVSRFMFDRKALPSLALGGNNSILTAVGNDYSYEEIFSRELIALGREGDVFIAISTSGNSPNILKAVETAKELNIETFGLTGAKGGKLNNLCKTIQVPSDSTARIQESHIVIGHIVCEIVESEIFTR